MVIDKPAYEQLLEFLTSNKEVFHLEGEVDTSGPTLEVLIEEEIGSQIITLCTQHDELETNHRSIIVREVDGIVYDIQQVLREYWDNPVNEGQKEFVHEFAGLVKNVFDSAIADLLD